MTKLRTTTPPAPLPVLRAAVFALVGTVLGVSARHLVAEGSMPWRQSVPAAAVLFAVGLAGARRPRPLVAVVAACGAAQTGLHLWLMAEHPDGSAGSAGSASMPTPGHMHHSMAAHTAWHDRLHGSPAMTAVHAVAAVLVAVLLHRADSVCWSLARGLTTAATVTRARVATAWALLTKHPATSQPWPPTVVRAWLERPPLKGAVLAHVVVRRGPPQAAFTHAI